MEGSQAGDHYHTGKLGGAGDGDAVHLMDGLSVLVPGEGDGWVSLTHDARRPRPLPRL